MAGDIKIKVQNVAEDMIIYCVCCKEKTSSHNVEKVFDKKRWCLKAICSNCGKRKNQFIKNTLNN